MLKANSKKLTDKDLTEVVTEIIREAIVDNGVYYDCNDAEKAAQEVAPAITSIILNPQFRHVRMNYDRLVELVTYLTVRLA